MDSNAARSARAVLLVIVLAAVAAGVTGWLAQRGPGAPSEIHYEVVKGDTLSVLARRFGVSVADLRRWNQLEGDRIEVGQDLLVGSGSTPTPRSNHNSDAPRTAAGPATGIKRPVLHRPAPKPCKRLADGNEGVIASRGLDESQIRAAMDGFLPNALACVPEGWSTGGTLETHLSVGCNGIVKHVAISDTGPFPQEMVACIQDTLGYASFPAHDQVDGMEFDYPVHISF